MPSQVSDTNDQGYASITSAGRLVKAIAMTRKISPLLFNKAQQGYRSIIPSSAKLLSMKTLLLFATLVEAKATISILKAQEEGAFYRFEQGYIVISGMGIRAAGQALFHWAPKIHSVCNLGVCASLHHHNVGEILEVGMVGSQAASSIYLGSGSRLFSSHYPVHSTVLREKLRVEWDILDMEGYGVATMARHLNIPCSFLKIVSDFAKEGGRSEIQKNLDYCSQKLALRIASAGSFHKP